ncbi:MAG: hypothetical protein IJ106_11035 [Parasporobacterium sp.]|nr:hypothetical protein [Parasporobacterium sp.]
MAKQKDLSRNGTTYKILEYAFFAGSFTVKQANLSMGGACGAHVVSRSIRLLHERRYIERICANGKRDDYLPEDQTNREKAYYTITEEGIRHLGKNSVYHKAIAEYAVRETSLSRAKEKEGRLNAFALARGAGLNTYAVQKPSFENLVCLLYDTIRKPEAFPPEYPQLETDDLPAYLKDGIYYTSAEVRRGLTALQIDLDTFLTTRFIGLCVIGDMLSLVYCHDRKKGYTILPPNTERALLETLRDLFPQYSSPSCVMLADSPAPVASISIGYPHGRNRREEERAQREGILQPLSPEEMEQILEREEARRRQLKGYAILARESSGILTGDTDLFREIYVVPVTEDKAGMFRKAVFSSRETMIREGTAFFETTPGFSCGVSRRGILSGMVFLDGTYLDAVYLPLADCKILTELRNRYQGELAVVTDPSLADVVSKTLGTRCGAFFNLEGHMIPSVRRYKDTGYPVEKDRFDTIRERNRSRARNLPSFSQG